MLTVDEIRDAIEICESDAGCARCAYKEKKDCCKALMTDALHMIREMTPRVMTAEEIINLRKNADVFVETRDETRLKWLTKVNQTRRSAFFDRGSFLIQFSMRDYNARWRCWTGLPSGEQRKNAVWM